MSAGIIGVHCTRANQSNAAAYSEVGLPVGSPRRHAPGTAVMRSVTSASVPRSTSKGQPRAVRHVLSGTLSVKALSAQLTSSAYAGSLLGQPRLGGQGCRCGRVGSAVRSPPAAQRVSSNVASWSVIKLLRRPTWRVDSRLSIGIVLRGTREEPASARSSGLSPASRPDPALEAGVAPVMDAASTEPSQTISTVAGAPWLQMGYPIRAVIALAGSFRALGRPPVGRG
jgi:hypothetical protein